jgi:hypothetical protein
MATAETMEEGLAKLQRLAKSGRADELFKFKTLTDFPAGSAFVASTFKMTDTKNGEACLVEVQYTLPNGKKTNATLMVAERFKEQCETKLPCLLYYGGKKDIGSGKQCHQLSFVDPGSELLDEDDGSDADIEVVDTFTPCEDCTKNKRYCYGFCPRCCGHQPHSGGQCDCRGL